jgi:Peptidase family M48
VHYSVYSSLAFAALFGVVAPTIVRRTSPQLATWLLTIGGLVSAVCAVTSLALLSMTVIGQNPAIAADGHWSIRALRESDPVRTPVAIAALALLGVVAVRFVWVSIRRANALLAAYRLNRSVDDNGADLVVVPTETLDAYAVPGRPGRVFVTAGMLELLSRDECTVMLSHERSHLRHRHHWHRTAVAVAQALNPLLFALPRTQLWATERWADEDAAHAGDRSVLASALARAAEARRAGNLPSTALAFTANTVDSRIAALLTPPPRRHPMALAVALAILVLAVYGALDGFTDEAQLFHAAIVGHYGPLAHFHHSAAHAAAGHLEQVRIRLSR